MRVLLGIVFITIIIFSCNSKKHPSTNYYIQKEKIRLDSLSKIDTVVDSTNIIEEAKALSNIMFGISEEKFEKEKSIFFEKTRGKLGEFKFFKHNIDGHYYNDKLYFVEIEGRSVGYEYYNKNMKSQVLSLFSILQKKYGDPEYDYGFPSWTDFDNNQKKTLVYWEIGNKKIELEIKEYDSRYTLYLQSYQLDIVRQKNKEWEMKERSEEQKAIDVL